MKVLRLLVVSAAPCLAWAFTVGCGSGGGYRGASITGGASGTAPTSGASGAGASSAGASGAGAGGIGGDAGGFSGAGGTAQGAEGGVPQAGAGGATSTGGQAGSAGDGMAGMGGLAGAAGVTGVAGDTTAGSAGIAAGGAGAGGAGAMSGSGGTSGSGGSGGAGVTGGFGGFGGTTGSGGSAGASGPLRTCGERCNTHSDCRVFGVDLGYLCNATTHRCERFAEPCRNALECIPDASFWIFTCRSDADCFFFSDDLCVDAGGVGRCARLAPSANGCMDPNPDEVMMPRFGASGSALVCANASLTCDGGECVPGCRTNADCTPAHNGSVCDTQTRLCRCVRDADCGGAGVSHCNTATGLCECTDSRECEEISNANACLSGRCGCSGVSACSANRTFAGTTYVCE